MLQRTACAGNGRTGALPSPSVDQSSSMMFLERPLFSVLAWPFAGFGAGFSSNSGPAAEGEKTGAPARAFWEIYTS